MRTPITIFFCVAFVGCGFRSNAREPRYQGKTLTTWLQLYQKADEGTAGERDATAAIQAIGTNALPYLMKWIASTDLDVGLRAQQGFKILGRVAAPAIPALSKLLTGTNEFVAIVVGPALGSIGAPAVPALLEALTNRSYKISLRAILAIPELGTNAHPVIPFLVAELRHPNHFYRERAADALGGLHIDPEVVVPALTNLVQDSSPAARFIAIKALGQFGPAARPAAPLILETLKTREDLQWVSKNALREIAPEMLTNAPAR
jgi:HEAT repeat protein